MRYILFACLFSIIIWLLLERGKVEQSMEHDFIEYAPDVKELLAEFNIKPYELHDFALSNEWTEKQAVMKLKTLSYYNNHWQYARQLNREFNVPIAVTLAIGKVESAAGTSIMYEENNVFNIKCWEDHDHSRCINFDDDAPTDMFKTYPTIYASYENFGIKVMRESNYSNQKRIHNATTKSWHNWASALKAAGYATDENWVKKVENEIKEYRLNYKAEFMALYESYKIREI
jgi:flagellum-specific peptidoglycan hydrolase FlgJ